MLFWILSGLAIAWFIFFMGMCIIERGDDYGEGTVFAMVVVFLILGSSPAIQYYSNIQLMSTVKYNHELVSMYEEEIESLEETIKDLDVPSTALMNADSPYTALVQTIAENRKMLMEQKKEMFEASKELRVNEHGLYNGAYRVAKWVME